MTENTSYIDRSHPVRAILERAASGHQPTKKDLDELLTNVSDERLPEGQSLDRFRADIVKHAADIAAIRATGASGPARTAAGEAASAIARRMTPEQRALNTSMTTNSKREIDDMITRVFEN